MIKKFENIRKYKKKMKIKRVDFESSINSFHRFFFEKTDKRERW